MTRRSTPLPILLVYLIATVTLSRVTAAVAPLPSLTKLRARLTELTNPSVCHVRRRTAIAAAQSALNSAAACKGLSSSAPPCPPLASLRKTLSIAKAKGCSPESSAVAINGAVRALEAGANARTRKHPDTAPPVDVLVVEPAGTPPYVTLVVVHELFSSANALVKFAHRALELGAVPSGVRIMLPQAPVAFNTLFNRTGPSWFDLLGRTATAAWASDEVDRAAANVSRVLDVDKSLFGGDRWKAGAIGFSQGGATVLATYMRHRLSAVASLSGFLPDPSNLPKPGDWKSRASPVLIIHSDKDKVVDVEFARQSAQLLSQLGRDVTYEELSGLPHNLGDRVMDRMVRSMDFVSRRMVPGRGKWEPSTQGYVWKLSAAK